MEPDEADRVVQQVQAGRKEAFRALFVAFERPVRIYLSAQSPSVEVVDEVLQATFVACFESIATYEPRGTFLFWLKGIARNRLLKELRERARHGRAAGDELDALVAEAASADAPEPDLAALERCLGKVAPNLRELMRERYVARTPVKLIAAQLGRTETWVSVALHRTRAFLRNCLGQRGPA